jgi:hypothetical protein
MQDLLEKEKFRHLCCPRWYLVETRSFHETELDAKRELGWLMRSCSVRGLVALWMGDSGQLAGHSISSLMGTNLILVSSTSASDSPVSVSEFRLGRMQIHLDCCQASMIHPVRWVELMLLGSLGSYVLCLNLEIGGMIVERGRWSLERH